MPNLNTFQLGMTDIPAPSRNFRLAHKGRIVTSLDGIDAKPLSWFSVHFQELLLDQISTGEVEFVVHIDRLLILRSAVEPYLPAGVDWEDL